MRQNDWPAANRVYLRLLRLEEPSARPTVALELARVCELADLPIEALEPLEQALSQAPDDVPLRRKLRGLYAKMGARRKEAQLLVEEASREGETQAKADRLLEASELFLRDGAFHEALEAALHLRAMVPDRIEALVLYARILVADGRAVEALAELRRFLDVHAPRPSKAVSKLYRQIADIHLAADELVEAFDALGQAHRMNKGEPEVAFTLGLLAVDLDELDIANSALRTFVAIKGEGMPLPAHDAPSPASQAYYHLAWIEHAKGRHAAARRMASRAVEEGPHNRDARQLLEKLTAS